MLRSKREIAPGTLKSLLNEISIWANQSAEVDGNSPFFGVRARQAGMDIYDFLRERGYYGSTKV